MYTSSEKKSKPASAVNGSAEKTSLFRKAVEDGFFNTKLSPAFFGAGIQAKLKISQPNDPLEKEADTMADAVMRMPDAAIATSETKVDELQSEDEQEETIQRLANTNGGGISISRNERSVASNGNSFFTRSEGSISPDHTASSFKKPGNGAGASLSAASNHFFKARMGQDFSNVKIHTGEDAEMSANDINARAYTVGEHIVFNKNEYNPNTFEGKKLLAHELAHVMQTKQGTVAAGSVQPQRSTPVPATAVVDPDTAIATFAVNSANVVVEPDQTLRRGTTVRFHGRRIRVNRTGAVTAASLRPRVRPTYTGTGRRRRVTSVSLTYTLYIKTFFGTRASASDSSAYGRGTTTADIAAGNTSLGFHEGSHGQDYQDYIAQNPLPQFTLVVPATMREYRAAMRVFNAEVTAYFTGMSAHSETHTDMVGTPMTP